MKLTFDLDSKTKLFFNKKKVYSNLITTVIIFIILYIPIFIIEQFGNHCPNLPEQPWYITGLSWFVFWFYIGGVNLTFHKPIYKFIKLKLFPM